MKLFTLVLLGFLLSTKLLLAQNGNATLLAQSPDGKTVKLIWFLKNWGNDITGFDIKRKEGLGDWVKLNNEPILPEISVKNKLLIVEADKTEASRIKGKLFEMIADNKIQEINHSDYLQKLMSGDKKVQDILLMMGHDYDIALMSGFGYIDHTVASKTDYQYGLFIQGTNKLLAKVSWNYGEIPDLNVVTEITSKATSKSKGIHIIWNVDMDKMKFADVASFNIYRQGIRLNQTPILRTNNNDLSEFMWYDKSANSDNVSQYSISAESILGIEGIIKSYTYNPEEHANEYMAAEVKEITSLGYYFKEGINIKWSFPAESEKFLKGFYVEKNNMPDGYKRTSPLLDPTTRTFIDKTPSPVSTYISMRVIAVYKDKTMFIGLGRLYNYFPIAEPPAPQSLKLKNVKEGKKIAIKLYWDPAMDGDTITNYYKVYMEEPSKNDFYLLTEKPIRNSYYTHYIEHTNASVYKFYITAASKGNSESLTSDTVSIQIPSTELPTPIIRNVFPDEDKAVIQWQYPEITDLKGFRLYQDKILIADEKELTKDKREFTSGELEIESTHEYTIIAESENNIESQVSLPVEITIPKTRKK